MNNTLFVSAIKHPEKKPFSLDLILELINNREIRLIGNRYLILEMDKYQRLFSSGMARGLLKSLKDKIEVKEIDRASIISCKYYFPKPEFADVVHAATCFKEKAILITNDKHFDNINAEGLIQVWKISRAIKELL